MNSGSDGGGDKQPVIGLIHTVSTLVVTFDQLVREMGGKSGVQAQHIVDEALLIATRREGLTTLTMRHLLSYAVAAQESGVDLVLVTCSSLGPAVDMISPLVDVPVLRVDEAMADNAIRMGHRIGVVATLETTLTPTVELIERGADRVGVDVVLDVRLCEGAFDAARRGDPDRHDEVILSELRSLIPNVDVVILAQASMERALGGLEPSDRKIPVLTSPRFAVRAALDVLLAAPRATSPLPG